jgi:hypothetical protein
MYKEISKRKDLLSFPILFTSHIVETKKHSNFSSAFINLEVFCSSKFFLQFVQQELVLENPQVLFW